MKEINNPNVVFYDVDDTLISWDVIDEGKAIAIDNNGMTEKAEPSDKTIKRLKEHKLAGCYNIVWSQNGQDWCKAVVKALNLEDYVDMVMTKPKFMYDDIDPKNWTLVMNLNKKV